MLWLSKNSEKVSFLGKHKSCATVDEWEMERPNVLHALVPLSLSKSLKALLKTNRNNSIKNHTYALKDQSWKSASAAQKMKQPRLLGLHQNPSDMRLCQFNHIFPTLLSFFVRVAL